MRTLETLQTGFRQLAPRGRRPARVILLALMAGVATVMGTLRAAPVAVASAPRAAPAVADTCMEEALNDSWDSDFTISFSAEASGDKLGTHQQSANIGLKFQGMQIPYGNISTWNASLSGATGSGNIVGVETFTDLLGVHHENRDEGSGAPAHVLATMELDRVNCTYDLWVQVGIKTVTSGTDFPRREGMLLVIDLHLDDEPLPPLDPSFTGTGTGTDTETGSESSPQAVNRRPRRIRWNGGIKVPIAPQMGDKRWFSEATTVGSSYVRTLAVHAGKTDIGTAQVSWDMQPNSARPQIQHITFSEPEFPSEKWRVAGQNGIVDGNYVMVQAGVSNPLNSLLKTQARFYDAASETLIKGCENVEVILPPAQVTPVFCVFDSDGWAWDDATPTSPPKAHFAHFIRVEVGPEKDLMDSDVKSLIIRPKPVILVHGINAGASDWNKYQGFLYQYNPYWKAYAIPYLKTGDSALPGFQTPSNTLMQNAGLLDDYIFQVRSLENAWHLDIVAHAMGGLIARQFLYSFALEPATTPTGKPVIRHLTMLGTPMAGTECANLQLGIALVHGLPNVLAPLELTPKSVLKFNDVVVDLKGAVISNLAGEDHVFKCPPPFTTASDGIVTVESARYRLGNVSYTQSGHTEMLSSFEDFKHYVLPTLALGRKFSGNDLVTQQADASTSVAPSTPTPMPQLAQTLSQTVAANATANIALSIPKAGQVAVSLIAPVSVTSQLLNPSGQVVDTIAAGSAATREWWRTSLITAPVAGAWTLRLQNLAPSPAPVIVWVQTMSESVRLMGQASGVDAAGRMTMTAMFNQDGAPLTGAQVTFEGVSVSGNLSATQVTPTVVALADDGLHGDGAAGDGVFGAQLSVKPGERVSGMVTARAGQLERRAMVQEQVELRPFNDRLYLPALWR